MRTRPCFNALALAILSSRAIAQTTAPTTGPADATSVFLVEQRRMIADELEKADVMPTRAIADLIRLSIEDGQLVARVQPPAFGDHVSMALPGEGAVVINRLRPRSNPELSSLDFEYVRLEAADANHPRATFFQLMTDPRGLSLTLNEQTPTITTNADLIDHPAVVPGSDEPPVASLRFARQAAEDADGKQHEDAPAADGRGAYLTAANFTALLDAHHDAVVSAMSEAFTSLRAMHVLSGLSDAQARELMHGDAVVDPDVARGVAGILDALRADGPDAVEPSVTKLAALGPTAVTALGAADRKGWSPDLKLSVDTVLAQVASMPASRAQLLLATPARLIDLLYWPDAAIRKAAAERLTSTPATDALASFDAAKDPYAQVTTIESARALIPHEAKSK